MIYRAATPIQGSLRGRALQARTAKELSRDLAERVKSGRTLLASMTGTAQTSKAQVDGWPCAMSGDRQSELQVDKRENRVSR